MSHAMRLKTDPRDGKGLCSDCRYLWVMETETHGGSKVFCMPCDEESSPAFLIPIHRPISACTRYNQTPRGNFSQFDAWAVTRDHEGVYLQKDAVRFFNGQYQRRFYKKDHWEWRAIPANELKGEL